ncbi:MAG: adenosine deaminase [Streptosporangiaceae bacterium]|nr:adenosine deaminase [Streptosporangiaceae bacterium]
MLPVAELHLHIEGTLEPELLVTLAARNGVPLPTTDLGELRARYRFASLRSFLDLYYESMRVLRTEQDFYDLASAYLTRAKAAGVRRAEIFFDPQSHTGAGVPIEAVFTGLSAALADDDTGISADLVMCFLRDLGPDAAMDTLEAALPFREKFIGVGLDSTEIGYPPALFRDVYRRAAAEGLRLVAHAAEEGPPDYVTEALDVLGAERIDHGVRSMEDPSLVARLRDERVPLTVCPLSNVALRVVPTMRAHMLPAMLDAGLMVTVNSDDPAYFCGYVDDNFAAVREEFGLPDETLAGLARNSFAASFAPDLDKQKWKAEVDAWLTGRDGHDRMS